MQPMAAIGGASALEECVSVTRVKERRQDIKVGVTPVLGDGP
jgi:hypothetical protein